MPYVYDPNLEDDESNQADPSQSGSAQTAGAGQVVGASGTQAMSTPQGQKGPTSSDKFQNLNDYLAANDNSNFGNEFVGKVQGEVDRANQTQTASAQQFKTQSDQAATTKDSDLVDRAVSDPYAFTQNQNDVDAFTKQRDASYTGPTSYADSGDAYKRAYSDTSRANTSAAASQNEGGRFGLLDQYFGRPSYTSGEKGLDNLLLSGKETTQQGLEQARKNAQASAVGFQNQGKELSDYAAANVAKTNEARDYVQNTLAPKVGETQKQYQDRLAQYMTEQDAKYNETRNALSGTDPAAYDPILAGFGTGRSNRTGAWGLEDSGYWGANPSQYLSEVSDPTLSSATSLEDQRRLNAFERLMGQQETVFDQAVAGSYDPNRPANFDTERFNAAVEQNKNTYGTAEALAKSRMDAIRNSPVYIGLPGDPFEGQKTQIQAQLDELNALRMQYGLEPIANPYTWGGSTGAPINPGLPF